MLDALDVSTLTSTQETRMTGLRLTEKPSFGGHEKFVFRDGWLKKGVDAVSEHPLIFSDDDALVILGVGKNMVRSIRHWCLATGLVGEVDGKERKRELCVTALGSRLMVDTGWDPFFEDSATLWLLHWQLVSNPFRSLVWHLLFSFFYEGECTKKSLAAFVQKHLERSGISTTSSMIDREIDCFLRTYTPSARGNRISEDSLDCPLTELDLVRFIPQDNVYRFNVGPKPSLSTEIFGYGLFQFLLNTAKHRKTVAVDECIYQAGSPGQLFRLDENSVVEHLETLSDIVGGDIRIEETAGLRQVYINSEADDFFDQAAQQLLEEYYAPH
jgi:hypothetical protein